MLYNVIIEIIIKDLIMTTINIRVDDELKKQSEAIFEEIGLNMTSALTIFLKAVVRNNGIPFSLEINCIISPTAPGVGMIGTSVSSIKWG